MSLFDRATFRVWTALSAAIAGTSTALALDTPDIPGLPSGGNDKQSFINIITSIIKTILDFLALIAVIFIIVAGIRLIISQGEEEAKEKAKKSIIYVIIGLIVVLISRIIVGFFTQPANIGLE